MEFAGVLRGVLPTRPRTVSAQVAGLLAWRWWPGVLALTAVVVSLPALSAGLLNDDYYHRALFAGPSESRDRLVRAGLLPDGAGGGHPIEEEDRSEGFRCFGFWSPVPGLQM